MDIRSAAAYYSFATIRLSNRNTYMVKGYLACMAYVKGRDVRE
jgi:hypothetical protein